jgi:hypothetical protein
MIADHDPQGTSKPSLAVPGFKAMRRLAKRQRNLVFLKNTELTARKNAQNFDRGSKHH